MRLELARVDALAFDAVESVAFRLLLRRALQLLPRLLRMRARMAWRAPLCSRFEIGGHGH